VSPTVADDFLLASGNYALALLELTMLARTPRSTELPNAIQDFVRALSELQGWAKALDAVPVKVAA
jgi:hypothetical protein